MLEVTFEINGKPIDPQKVGDVIERATYEAVVEWVVQRVGDVRDPETGEVPKINVVGKDLAHLSFEISGSDRVVAMAKQRLQEDPVA